MKTKHILLPFLLVVLLLASCNLIDRFTGPDESNYYVTLAVGATYNINCGQSGDEQGVQITTAPLHGSRSELYRDSTTYEIHYLYVPDSAYVGADYFKLALISYEAESTEPTIDSYIVGNFVIE